MYISTSVVTIICVLGMSYGATLHTVNCGSHASVQSATLQPCDHEPCQLMPGSTYHLTVAFTSPEFFSDVTTNLQGKHGFINIPFPVADRSACNVEVTCPITPGPSFTYNTNFTVPSGLSQVHLAMKSRLTDSSSDKDVFCFVFTGDVN